MAMQPGFPRYEIEYVTPDGRSLKAELGTIHYGHPDEEQSIRWFISGTPDEQTWLGYTAHDGQLWWTRLYATHAGPWNNPVPAPVDFRLEHRGPGSAPGGDPGNLPEPSPNPPYLKNLMGFLDHQGQQWLMVHQVWNARFCRSAASRVAAYGI